MNVQSAIERGITSNTQAIYTLYIGSIFLYIGFISPARWNYIPNYYSFLRLLGVKSGLNTALSNKVLTFRIQPFQPCSQTL